MNHSSTYGHCLVCGLVRGAEASRLSVRVRLQEGRGGRNGSSYRSRVVQGFFSESSGHLTPSRFHIVLGP